MGKLRRTVVVPGTLPGLFSDRELRVRGYLPYRIKFTRDPVIMARRLTEPVVARGADGVEETFRPGDVVTLFPGIQNRFYIPIADFLERYEPAER